MAPQTDHPPSLPLIPCPGETVDVDPFSGDVFVSGLDSNQKHNLYRVNSQTHELKSDLPLFFLA